MPTLLSFLTYKSEFPPESWTFKLAVVLSEVEPLTIRFPAGSMVKSPAEVVNKGVVTEVEKAGSPIVAMVKVEFAPPSVKEILIPSVRTLSSVRESCRLKVK
ncbi:hypothetical protein ES707_05795 [subsurface metagenome]